MWSATILYAFVLMMVDSYIFPPEFNETYQLNHSDASAHCMNEYNSELVSIHSEMQLEEIRTGIKKENVKFWIGLTVDGTRINQYSWTNNSLFDFYGEQFNYISNTDVAMCINIGNDLKWYYANCSQKRYWICNDGKIKSNESDGETINVAFITDWRHYIPTKHDLEEIYWNLAMINTVTAVCNILIWGRYIASLLSANRPLLFERIKFCIITSFRFMF
eukprot:89088_1